ncbi:hypothetical protein V6N13_058310 [Hibiscus sabdariffa]|uniref:Uncharacterized protein n=1 Tax=Hibiscus sabdariffa TaxID=183260 RepID=A0ABR2GHS8_9ROSI
MNKDSTPIVKKSGTNSTPISRPSKKKENTTQSPQDASLFRRRGTGTIMESKQLTLNEAAQPLNGPVGLSKKCEISRIRTLIQSVKKKPNLSTFLLDWSIMVEPVELLHQKSVMKKKEKAQHPKNPVGLDKNIGTSSIIPTSMHNMQKKKATHLPTRSGSSAKKIETTSRSPTMKLFVKKEKIQPSKGSAGVASKSGTRRTLPSRLGYTEKRNNQRQKHHICKDHIVWEGCPQVPSGFDGCIVRSRRAVYYVMVILQMNLRIVQIGNVIILQRMLEIHPHCLQQTSGNEGTRSFAVHFTSAVFESKG